MKKPLCFRVIHSRTGTNRVSQTHCQDGSSKVPFMLDLEGGEVGFLVEFWAEEADGSTESQSQRELSAFKCFRMNECRKW